MSAAEPIERRHHDRISVAVSVSVSAWTLVQATRLLAGSTVDVSIGGSLLWLPELSPLATTLDLTLALPDGPLHVTAEVRWRREPGLVGVHFQRISLDDQARLVEFLRQQR